MRRPAAILAAALIAAPAFAQEGPLAVFAATDEGAQLTLYPLNCSADVICPYVVLVCEADGDFRMDFRRLLAEHEERFLGGGNMATLWNADARLDLFVDRFYETDDEFGIFARLFPEADAAPWLALLPGTLEIAIVTPFFTFFVVPAEADAEPIAAFAAACAAPA